MAIRVVKEEYNGNEGVVVLEGDTQDEVVALDARHKALQVAGARLQRAGLAESPSPYPVNAQGESSDELILGRAGPASAFRADYRVMGAI